MPSSANTRNKSVIVCVIGQSNERGKRQLATVAEQDGAPTESSIGCYNADPIQPEGDVITPTNGYYGSIWPKLSEEMWKHNKIWMHFKNEAHGSTGWVQDWCGHVTGVPLNSADGGWDPNTYLAQALASVQEGEYDERWIFMANGQKDSADAITQANYQLAIENIVNYFLDNNIKVAVGFSVYQSAWSTGTGVPGMEAALNTFSANSNVIAGGDLTTSLGTNPYMFDSHMGIRSYDLSVNVWRDALITAGW